MNARLTGAALCVAALSMLSPVRAAGTVDAKSNTVLAASRQALGLSSLAHVSAIRTDAKLTAIGLSGTGTQYADLVSGRFAEYAALPPFEQDDGFDGKVAWNRDGAGVVWNDGSDAGRSVAIDNAFMNSYGLWKTGAAEAAVTYVGQQTEKGRVYDVLRVQPRESKLPVDVWFDTSTHLPERTVLTKGSVVTSTILSDYRRTHGAMLPYAVHVDSSDGNNSDAAVTRIAFDPKDGASHLTRPTSHPHDSSMRAGMTSTTIPFDLVENHVYLNVMLNGKGPYRFIFDTGGQNVVDPAVAREIGALSKGSAQGSGVGAQTESLSFAKVDSLQVGDAVLRNQLFAVAPVHMGFGISAGQPADGLIGWEVLARYVTSFDYAQKQVVLTLPNAAKTSAGHVIPFVFNGTQPQIACAIDAIPSECTIDTGARDTMSFYGPYLESHPQVVPAKVTAAGMTGFGFGGPSFGKLGRVSSIQIDDLTLHDMIADFSTQTAGAFASPFTAANLGGNLLRRFDITFDYSKETMALVPNATFSEPDAYERAGLFLIRKDGKPVIADVRPGTPAAQAGLAKGDTIESIDGTAVSSLSLDAVRAYFFKPAGTVLTIRAIAKDGTERSISLTLRDYV